MENQRKLYIELYPNWNHRCSLQHQEPYLGACNPLVVGLFFENSQRF